jgi:hypothetical protein
MTIRQAFMLLWDTNSKMLFGRSVDIKSIVTSRQRRTWAEPRVWRQHAPADHITGTGFAQAKGSRLKCHCGSFGKLIFMWDPQRPSPLDIILGGTRDAATLMVVIYVWDGQSLCLDG